MNNLRIQFICKKSVIKRCTVSLQPVKRRLSVGIKGALSYTTLSIMSDEIEFPDSHVEKPKIDSHQPPKGTVTTPLLPSTPFITHRSSPAASLPPPSHHPHHHHPRHHYLSSSSDEHLFRYGRVQPPVVQPPVVQPPVVQPPLPTIHT